LFNFLTPPTLLEMAILQQLSASLPAREAEAERCSEATFALISSPRAGQGWISAQKETHVA
jgi:hypothetical protein